MILKNKNLALVLAGCLLSVSAFAVDLSPEELAEQAVLAEQIQTQLFEAETAAAIAASAQPGLASEQAFAGGAAGGGGGGGGGGRQFNLVDVETALALAESMRQFTLGNEDFAVECSRDQHMVEERTRHLIDLDLRTGLLSADKIAALESCGLSLYKIARMELSDRDLTLETRDAQEAGFDNVEDFREFQAAVALSMQEPAPAVVAAQVETAEDEAPTAPPTIEELRALRLAALDRR